MKLSSTEFAKSRSALWRFRKGKMREGNALQIMKQEASLQCVREFRKYPGLRDSSESMENFGEKAYII